MMNKQEILKQCTVDGHVVKLPQVQLDRDQYVEIKKSLELIGGKWKGGKTQGFVFQEDPTDYLAKLCDGEQINLKKDFQFFATPPEVADYLVELADIQPGHTILEPSAGQGAIIKAIQRIYPDIVVDCFELMDLNRTFLEKLDNVSIIGQDFIQEEKERLYDRIIANPPFSKNQDIEHFAEMFKCLKDGGRIVSIMSNHWRFASGKKEAAFQAFVEDSEAQVYDIDSGAFKDSGTTVSACIVVVDRRNPELITNLLKSIGSSKPGKKSFQSSSSETKQSRGCGKTAKEDIDYKNLPEPKEILENIFSLEKDICKGLGELKGMLSDGNDDTGASKPATTKSESKKAEKDFIDMFNLFTYRHAHAEVFIDFLDYTLLAMKWWDRNRDFSPFEKKYGDLYPSFIKMFELLGIASDNGGTGFHDVLGDLFMELVSHGRNGQFFTPEYMCTMLTTLTCGKIEDGQNILDPACGSARMLLAAGKVNRKARFFGCDNDITCCKMAVINLLLNSMSGEIALMDTLRMDYTKSWECSCQNLGGMNMPVYRVIENKDESTLWMLHMNSFHRDDKVEVKETDLSPVPEPEPIPAIPVISGRARRKKLQENQLMFDFAT